MANTLWKPDKTVRSALRRGERKLKELGQIAEEETREYLRAARYRRAMAERLKRQP